jgi:lipoprotein-anchoring transpeptidase ErfK/SrfK
VGYNLQKHQVFAKMGEISIDNHSPVVTTPDLTVPTPDIHSHRHLVPLAAAGGVMALFLIATALFFTVAHGSFASIYVAGIPVKANVSQTDLEKQISTAAKNYKVKVKYTDGKVKTYPLSETGIAVNAKQSAASTKKLISHSWLQRLEWWQPIQADLVIKTNDISLYDFVDKDVTQVKVAPKDAALVINNGAASITPEAEGSGSTVPNGKKVVANNVKQLSTSPLVLKPMKLAPAIKTTDLETSKKKADTLLTKPVAFTIAGHNVTATSADIGGWLDVSPVPNSKTVDVTVNSGKVLQYIDKVARRYVTPPHSRLVTNTDGGLVVLDPGSDGVDVVNKDKTAADVAKKVASDPSVNVALAVQYTSAKTVETQAYDKWFVADVTTKRMYAYEGTTLVHSFLISAGAPATPTVIGTYSIYAKYRSQTMTGLNADGSRYNQPDVPYVNYFTGGYAIHGNYWRPAGYFGNINSSHGCIGINVSDAAWIYDWAPIGTKVITHT